MAVSLLLHIAGALKHHIIDKDVTLRRMWFGQTDVPHLTKHRSPAAAPILAVAVFAATGWLASTWHADAAAPLAAVSSEWEVQDGTLSIGVTQSGSDISGEFSEWTAQIAFNPEATPNYGDVTATIAIGSLTLGTLSAQALGADYFDATAFPTATFQADIVDGDDGAFEANGTLTIKGISVPVSMPFALDIEGSTATMTGNLTVNRRDFTIGDTTDDATLAPQVLIQIALTAIQQ